MKDRNCPDYKSLCEDSNDKGDKGVSVTTPDISGSWTSNIDVSYSISQIQSAASDDSSRFTWEKQGLKKIVHCSNYFQAEG